MLKHAEMIVFAAAAVCGALEIQVEGVRVEASRSPKAG